ncbi:hypothetical protein FPV67DRAFT_1759024 [Lyophyllum atratum]|nr:hypothetical protein FPV67DRAFT_1759024 [Lyophyllum atratum]
MAGKGSAGQDERVNVSLLQLPNHDTTRTSRRHTPISTRTSQSGTKPGGSSSRAGFPHRPRAVFGVGWGVHGAGEMELGDSERGDDSSPDVLSPRATLRRGGADEGVGRGQWGGESPGKGRGVRGSVPPHEEAFELQGNSAMMQMSREGGRVGAEGVVRDGWLHEYAGTGGVVDEEGGGGGGRREESLPSLVRERPKLRVLSRRKKRGSSFLDAGVAGEGTVRVLGKAVKEDGDGYLPDSRRH